MAGGPGQLQIVRRWREERELRRARIELIKILPRVSAPLTAWLVGSIALGTLVPVVMTVATGVTLGAIPAAIEQGGFDSPAGQRVIAGLAVVAGLFVLRRVTEPFEAILTAHLFRRVTSHLFDRVMRATLRPVGIAHLEDPAMRDRIRDAHQIGAGTTGGPGTAIRGMASNTAQRLATIGQAALVSRFSVWLAVALVSYSILVRYRLVGDMLRVFRAGTGETRRMRRSDYFRDLALRPEAAKESRVFGLGGWMLDRFRTHWLSGMEFLWRERREGAANSWWWSIPWGGLILVGLAMAGTSAARGDITLQTLTITVSAILSAGSIYLSDADFQVATGTASVPALFALEDATARVATDGASSSEPVEPAEAPVEIRFEGVHFTYPGRTDEVFADLDLTIEPGRSVAIVGPNGAGKTTLVKLLARLYEPSAGAILAGGIDLRRMDARAWQRRVGAIFQDFVRYELSAAHNVALGAPSLLGDREAIERAAAKVGIDTTVEGLPNGWDTVLSRKYAEGGELSGGQWQRIALARALFAVEGGARFLVLDEPTANLDVRAEAELFDRFLELTRGVTTILISHRFSTVRHADRIVVLEHGRVVEDGSHPELLAAGGRYATMFNLQAARFRDEVPDA